MAAQETNFYEFGRFRLDAAERVLWRDHEPVSLTPKVFEILLALVERSGHVVEKDDLMKRVWPDTFVEEGNLTQNVSLLRKALGETSGGPQYIETISRRGYRFVADVRGGLGGDKSEPFFGLPGLTPNQDNVITSAVAPVRPADNEPSAFQDLDRTRATGLRTRWDALRAHKPALLFAAAAIVLVAIVYFTGLGWAGNAEAKPIESIAVLPFVDYTSDTDAEFLTEKISESVINSLSKLPRLRVVPRSVVAHYKGKDIDPRKVGRELNVRAVVTGQVRRHGDMITIQADLIDLENVAQIWGQHYDRKLSDFLIVQDDISRNIFENLRLKLNVEEKKRLEAYGLYLKGRNAWNKRTEDGLRQGIEYFQRAINTDPTYAPAYSGLADCYNMLVVYGVQQPKEGFPKAKEAAIKALEIDESLAEAHTSLAFINFRWDWDRVEAEREFLLAIRHQPSYPPAHQWYSSYLVALERFDEAIAEAKRTQELEPFSLIARSHLGWILYLAGQNDQAIEQCTKILDLDPNFFPALRYRGLAYAEKKMYREAIGDFQKGVKLSGSPLMLALLGQAYAASGQKDEAQKVLEDLGALQDKRYVSPYTVAGIYAGLGDRDQSFKWLEKAFEERDIWLMNLKVDPVFSRLRSDRRFPDLLLRTGLRP